MASSNLAPNIEAPQTASETDPALRPDLFEKLLATAAIALLVLVTAALLRGRGEWANLESNVWMHLALVLLAIAITPAQLLRRRGDLLHRTLGWIWAVSLFSTAMVSFAIRDLNDGGLSFVHIFSAVTVLTVPALLCAARHHRIARHRNAVRWLVTGALLTAGYFTILPGRILGGWLWH